MNITTIEELKKHIGEFLAFESHSPNGHLTYVWIQKLHTVTKTYCFSRQHKNARISEVDGLITCGLYTAEVYPRCKVYTAFPEFPYRTNAQSIIRTPTKEEMKTFQNMWRKYRILGDTSILDTKYRTNISHLIY